MNSYHFSLDNSTKGFIGFCAMIMAESKEAAVARLRDNIPLEIEVPIFAPAGSTRKTARDYRFEYLTLYVNPDVITIENIDKEGSAA